MTSIKIDKVDEIITLNDSEDEEGKKNTSKNGKQLKNIVKQKKFRQSKNHIKNTSDCTFLNENKSRRKSSHYARQIDDDISFENVATVPNTQSDTPVTSKINKKGISKATIKSCLEEQVPESIKDDDNLSSMKRVAFLKASVNYTLLQIGMTPYQFNGPVTLSDLMKHYYNSNVYTYFDKIK